MLRITLAADISAVTRAFATETNVLGQAAKTATWPRVSIKQFYWQLYIMLSPPLIAVPGVQPMPLRAA